TPLAAITGAATSLLEDGKKSLPESSRHQLAQTIADEAGRLNRLIGDLLEMTRLESGALRVRKEWHSMEEVVGVALGALESRLAERRIQIDLPKDLPLEIRARVEGNQLLFTVADRGPGLRAGEERRAFEKFYREPDVTEPGVG